MACENKKTRRLSTVILCLMFYGLPLVAPRNIDCKGKPFHCVNSTHFIICVDLGGGISSTVDDVIIPCPESTICDINNYFECEFPPPTTLTLPIQPSDVSNESGIGKNKVITKVSWENIDITTTSPMQKTSERSEKYLNNVTITIPEEFTTAKAKLDAIIDNQSTTIQQDNINRQSQNNSNEKKYQQFTGNSMIDESSNLTVALSDINKDETTNGTKLNSYTIDTKPIQTNEEFKDIKLSSVGTGTESTSLQSSMSPPETTEFYSYTPVNRDVITFDSSFTTNSEMPTSDIMSANTPILSNLRSKSSQIFKLEIETTSYAVTPGTIPESKEQLTVEPKVITLSYNSGNSSSQINNDNSPAEATLTDSNPVNKVNVVNEYLSSNSTNDPDNKSYFNEYSVTESFTNITPKLTEKYLQSSSTQDHLSSIVSKHFESEQLNDTMNEHELKNTTNIIEDINTRPNITKVQKGSANQENSDLSVSNSMRTNQLIYTTDNQALTESINSSYIKVSDNNKKMSKTIKNSQNLQETDKIKKNESNPPGDYALKTIQEILPATDASIFLTHKQNRVEDQIKENITKINIHNETSMNDLNTNNYVTDSYGVSYDQSILTFDETNFSKNGYTKSEVTYNNTTNSYRTDEVIATTTERNNDIMTTAMHNNTERTKANQSKMIVDYISKTLQDNSSPVISTYNTHEGGIDWPQTQTKIIVPYSHNGTAISESVNKNDVVNSDNKTHQESMRTMLEQSNSTANYDSDREHTIKSSNNRFGSQKVFTTTEQNIKTVTTAFLDYKIQIKKEKIKTDMSKTHKQVAVDNETQERISIPYIYNGTTISNSSNNYVNENSNSNNQYKSTQAMSELNCTKSDDLKNENTTNNSKNDKSFFTTIEPNIDVKTTDLDYKFQNNREIAIKELSNSAIDDLKSGTFYSNESSGFENYEVIVTTIKPNIQMIKTALSYDLKINKEEATNNSSRTHEINAIMQQTQKNITTSFIHGEKATTDLNIESYKKEDRSIKNQYQSTQITNEVVFTTADLNIDMIRTTAVPNYNSQKNKEQTTKNMSKTHKEGVEKHATPKNITTLLIHDGKAMTDLNNNNYVKEDSSGKNQYQSTQTTNSGNEEVIFTTTIELNIDMITKTLPNYNFENNTENTKNNVLKTHDKGAVMHETQKDIITSFIMGEKAMTNLNNTSYAKEDSSSKNLYQSTQATNSGNDEVVGTTAGSNIDTITKIVPNYDLKKNKEETTKILSKTHEEGVVKHETPKNISTLLIHDGKAISQLNNKSYVKEDSSSSSNQFQSTQTTNPGNDESKVTTDSNTEMITTTIPNYDSQRNKAETRKNMSKTHEGVVRPKTQKNITTIFILGGKAMADLNNKNYVKEESSNTNKFQSTQITNSGNDEIKVSTTDSNIEMITITVPNYNSPKNMSKTHEEDVVRQEIQKNITSLLIHNVKAMSDLNNKNYTKEDSSSTNQFQSTQTINSGNDKDNVTTTDSNIEMIRITVPNYNSPKNMSRTHEEDVVRQETRKNITTLLIQNGKAMSDLNNKSDAKEDSSSTNQFQSTQTINSGNDEIKVAITDSNIEMITITVPNYNSPKNMSKTHEEGVVRQETQKNITTILMHGGKALADLNNENYVKEDSTSKNQFQSTQTTNTANHKVIVTNTEPITTTPIIHGGQASVDLNNKSFARDKDSKLQYQSTQTSKIIEHNTTITTDVPDLMFTKVNDSGMTTNLNNYTDTFVSPYGSNTYITKNNIHTDRLDISDRLTTITHKNLQETESTDINGDKMTATQITNDLSFKPTSAPLNELKISSETKSSTPASKVEGTISADSDFAETLGDRKLEKNDKPLTQEISSRTNRQAENQMEIFELRGNRTTNNYHITTIIASENPPNSSEKYGEDLSATSVPKHADVKVLTTISEEFNSYTHKQIGVIEKNTMLPVINAKDLITVAEDFLTTVTTASYNLKKKLSTTRISKESMNGITYVNNGRESTVSSSQYDEPKVVESKPLQVTFPHSLNIDADTTVPPSESDKVTSVLNRAVNTRNVTLLKQNAHTENYQSAEGTVLSLINLTSLSPSPLDNNDLDTSVTKTSVDNESATDTSNNKQQLKKTEVSSKPYFNITDAEINENKPNHGITKSILSRDITYNKTSTTSKGINEKFRNESVLNNNQQPDIISSEMSTKVGSNTGLNISTTEQNIAQMIPKHLTDIKQNSSRFLRKTTTHYASSTISSLESLDRSITTAKIKKNIASTIRNTNDTSDATLVTDSTINKRMKKSKTYNIGKEILVENLHESDGNISSTTLNKYKDFSNISNSNTTMNADEPSQKHYLISATLASGMITQSPMNINTKPLTMMEKTEKEYLDNRSKKLNKNFEITSESTKFFISNDQNPNKHISVNSDYTTVSNVPQRVLKYYSNSTTRGSIKTTMKNTTTMAKRIRDVNAKSINTAPTNVVVILFDYGRQKQKKERQSPTNHTNNEENPDDNINAESNSHNRYENTDHNDIKVEPMTTNNADNDNDPQNSPTSKVAVRVNDTNMVRCGRYTRGRYPDKNDCRRFYVCVGRNPPIKGICPNNTVYSESRKQCTRNLSHCVRNNKFKCLAEGRFSDFLKDDIYHICIKNKLGAFVVYKFQCQNGFRLDKKIVKCIKETENSSSSMSSASESSKSNNKSTTEKTSKAIDKFECQEEGKFADTRDCRTYYVCSKKRNVYRRKKKKCESDERFDRDKKKCVDAESYECDI